MDFFVRHWLLSLLLAAAAGLVLIAALRSRARRRQLARWMQERRRQRQMEEQAEAERRRLAQEEAAERLCRTEEDLARAAGQGLAEITIEGKLAQRYNGGGEALQRLGDYRIALARHGKVVLRRAGQAAGVALEPPAAAGLGSADGRPDAGSEPSAAAGL
jgi:hypothetical protein